jgi:periplasmic protein TonB
LSLPMPLKNRLRSTCATSLLATCIGSVAQTAAPPAVSPPPPVVAGPVATPPPRQLDIRSVSYRQPPRLLYPPAARRLLEEGTALVRVLVDAAGTPERVELLRSSGHARLDEAALAAARLARFHPHTEDGRALPFWVVMPLLFELD